MPSLSSAILPPAPEISPTQNSPFRYADQIDNFCQPDDNYRGWQDMEHGDRIVMSLAQGCGETELEFSEKAAIKNGGLWLWCLSLHR